MCVLSCVKKLVKDVLDVILILNVKQTAEGSLKYKLYYVTVVYTQHNRESYTVGSQLAYKQ